MGQKRTVSRANASFQIERRHLYVLPKSKSGNEAGTAREESPIQMRRLDATEKTEIMIQVSGSRASQRQRIKKHYPGTGQSHNSSSWLPGRGLFVALSKLPTPHPKNIWPPHQIGLVPGTRTILSQWLACTCTHVHIWWAVTDKWVQRSLHSHTSGQGSHPGGIVCLFSLLLGTSVCEPSYVPPPKQLPSSGWGHCLLRYCMRTAHSSPGTPKSRLSHALNKYPHKAVHPILQPLYLLARDPKLKRITALHRIFEDHTDFPLLNESTLYTNAVLRRVSQRRHLTI